MRGSGGDGALSSRDQPPPPRPPPQTPAPGACGLVQERRRRRGRRGDGEVGHEGRGQTALIAAVWYLLYIDKHKYVRYKGKKKDRLR
jgi:hypothetical protein